MTPRAKPASPITPASFVPPYPPSWVDRFMSWVDRLPGPAWLCYLALFAVMVLLLALAHWAAGAYPRGSFNGLHVLVPAGLVALFVLMEYFNRTAARALQDFRLVLLSGEVQYEDFRFRMTTLPPWPALWAGVGFLIFILGAAWTDAQTRSTPGNPPFVNLLGLLSTLRLDFRFAPTLVPTLLGGLIVLISWLAMGALAYQILRQLRIISDIYSHYAIVDLFRLEPLYALSRHTARIAITLLVLTVLLAAIIPNLAQQEGSLIVEGLFVAVAGGAFVWPLLGVHRLLAAEKERMLSENGRMMKATVADLHRTLGTRQRAGVDRLHLALTSLEIERAVLVRIPTWPWAPETLRSVLAALLFPVVVWAIQFGLGRWLG